MSDFGDGAAIGERLILGVLSRWLNVFFSQSGLNLLRRD